jgi:hypothetical protein
MTEIAMGVFARSGFQVTLLSDSCRRGIELVRRNEAPVLAGMRYAELMTRGMQALRANGELAAILKRYGLWDWKGTARP